MKERITKTHITIFKRSFLFQVTDTVPTFNQFVQYVLSKPYGKWDRHYEIMWRRCNVCQIKYDFVGKLESFDRDVDQVYKYVSQLYQISASLFKQSIITLPISFHFQFEKCLIQKGYKRFILKFKQKVVHIDNLFTSF